MNVTVSMDTPGIQAVNVSKPTAMLAAKKDKTELHLKFGFIIAKQ